jgi:hypothetical protein
VIAFIFFLLCTISSPIVQSIYLFQASTTGNNINSHVQFGTFGGCGTTSNIRYVFQILTDPVADLPRATSRFPRPYGAVACTPTELSYEILTSEPYQTSSGSYTSRSSVLVDTHTTGALILNPIACGLAGLVMILAPIAALVSGRVVHGVSPVP